MMGKLKKYFDSVNIEYFAVLDYRDCREISPNIIARADMNAQSIIIYLLPYYTGEAVNISRYAVSLDYHIAISEINSGLTDLIKSEFPESKIKGYGDHSPIDERHAAIIGGLGILGDNGLIINEKYGSYVFVGDVVTDIDPKLLGAMPPQKLRVCERCGACKKNCPTGILRFEGEDCLSAITQRKGELRDDECSLMRKYNTAWGCDLCQSVCIHNKNPEKTPVEFFYRDRIEHLTREALDSMTDEEFSMRAYAWRKRATISRNIDILDKK